MTTVFIIFVVFMIVFGFAKKVAKGSLDPNAPNPRLQKFVERLEAQQAANRPPQVQGQYTQPASGQPTPQARSTGRAQTSAQLAGMLQQLLQAGQQRPGPDQYPPPGQQGQYGAPGLYPAPQTGYAPPGQFQPVQYQPQAVEAQYQQGPVPRPVQNQLPRPNGQIENRVRELMSTGHEVAAIRLLCDEQDMGIIEAQAYARGLVAPACTSRQTGRAESAPRSEPVEEETRYVGSAAFAESVFDLDSDENVWASGWVDKPDPDDRSDLDELWQTVHNNGRPNS